MGRGLREKAAEYHNEQDWAGLADLYSEAAELAWKQGFKALGLRLLIAEATLGTLLGDETRVRESTYFLAMRHRLQAAFLPAEAWTWVVLRSRLTDESASRHASGWRELAAIREVAGDYDQALAFCDRAEEVCVAFDGRRGILLARIKALLQRASVLRLRGSLDLSLEALAKAGSLADSDECDPLTRGIVLLRKGGAQIVIGRPDAALVAYREAERLFTDVSEHNRLLARVRQISCLRALGRFAEGLALCDELIALYPPGAENYRLGQVLLERAELLQGQGDEENVGRTLEQARPHFEGRDSLESLRWHRHMARHLIQVNGDLAEATRHLCFVLSNAGTPGRADLTRTMLALHDLTRLPEQGGPPFDLRLAASRAALVAADSQRDSLRNPAERWATHALREEVYSAALLLHAGNGDSSAVAQITELGRADLLNQILASDPNNRQGALVDLPVVPRPRDPELLQQVFTVAEASARALESGGSLLPVGDLPLSGALPSNAELDELADIIVMSHLTSNSSTWWASIATRQRGGVWTMQIRDAPASIATLLDRLNAGGLLSPRGITTQTWEQLGTFLLPDPAVWEGSAEVPRTVLICPDPRQWQIPHGALIRSGVFLNDVAEVTLTPSLRTSRLLIDRAAKRPENSTGSWHSRPAMSILDTSLPGHEVESAALAVWPGGHERLVGIDSVPSDGPRALLYVSGHGDRPGMKSVLGPSRLTLDTLATQRLTPLVILNGCWSGSCDGHYGQDPLSLSVGALLGGADAVVGGIGHIGSYASAHIATRLFSHLQSGIPLASALRQVQRRTRTAHPELGPFDWAALTVIGTGAWVPPSAAGPP